MIDIEGTSIATLFVNGARISAGPHYMRILFLEELDGGVRMPRAAVNMHLIDVKELHAALGKSINQIEQVNEQQQVQIKTLLEANSDKPAS